MPSSRTRSFSLATTSAWLALATSQNEIKVLSDLAEALGHDAESAADGTRVRALAATVGELARGR